MLFPVVFFSIFIMYLFFFFFQLFIIAVFHSTDQLL